MLSSWCLNRVLPLLLLTTWTLVNAQSPAVEKIDLNTADVATLDRVLDGIGEKKARAIVDYREKHGPFQSIYDLTQVMGIGEKIVERNKDRMEVSISEEKTASPEEKTASSSPEKSLAPPPTPSKEKPETSSKTDEK